MIKGKKLKLQKNKENIISNETRDIEREKKIIKKKNRCIEREKKRKKRREKLMVKMSNIGFGTALYTYGKEYRFNFDVMYKVLDNYFNNNNGYVLDTADKYGNIDIVGKCLKKLNLNRDLMYLIGKIYPITSLPKYKSHKLFSSNKKVFIEKVNKMLLDLQTDYLDELLIHGKNWDSYDKKASDYDSVNTFSIMYKLKKKGLIKNIGVSNYTIDDIENIYNKLKIYPDSVQIHLSLYNFDDTYINYCQKRQIRIFCYGSLAGINNKFMNKYNKDVRINYDIIQKILKKYNCNEKELITSLMKIKNIKPIISSINHEYKAINDNIKIDKYDTNVLCSLSKPINICKYNLYKKAEHIYHIKYVIRPDIYDIVKSSFDRLYKKSVGGNLRYNFDIINILKKNVGLFSKKEKVKLSLFFNYLNTNEFLNDTIKNIFWDYLKKSNEFLLDLGKIKMSNHKGEFTLEELQNYSRKLYKDIKTSHIDKNDLYSIVNFQNRCKKKTKNVHKDHEYRLFSLVLYCCSNDTPTQIYDGPSVKNKGNIIYNGYPIDNCATIFLINRNSVHGVGPNIREKDREVIYISIASNLLAWKYVSGVND